MSVLLIGSEGSMGKRYQAILRYLDAGFIPLDLNTPSRVHTPLFSSIIIATPTETHADLIHKYVSYRKPILCEKPITKDICQLDSILNSVEKHKTPFSMMYQYSKLIHKSFSGDSSYNYFRHGNDGLIWDCLQIIGLAKGNIKLSESSPIWKCHINGQILDQSRMDWAYLNSVSQFLRQDYMSSQDIYAVHKKVSEFKLD